MDSPHTRHRLTIYLCICRASITRLNSRTCRTCNDVRHKCQQYHEHSSSSAWWAPLARCHRSYLYDSSSHRRLHGTALPYLMDSCTLTADVTGRQHLRSATQPKLIVPRYRLNGFGRRSFAVAGPSTWNSLPDSLHDPELSRNTFKRWL